MTDLGVRKCQGMGRLDLLLAVIIASLLAAVAVPAYDIFADRARIARAVDDIGSISIEINRFYIHNNQLPDSLGELPIEIPMDPWGAPYRYLNIAAAGQDNRDLRIYGGLNPLNSDFDLFSMGADGDSSAPLSAKAGRDDIVRANNGAFIGPGEDF